MTRQLSHRENTAERVAERLKRARADVDEFAAEVDQSVKTPTLSEEAKRTLSKIEDDTAANPSSHPDYYSTYNSHKQEIDAWYDDQYSRRLGLAESAKRKHSDAPWFIKVEAWVTAHGRSQPSHKKRKLDDSAAVKATSLTPPPRPDRIRYPEDLVPVPDCPFDKLSDFETMPDGNYACGHVGRKPPLACCVEGLSRSRKAAAIRKSVGAWRSKVERMIEEGKLSKKHKTWEDWADVVLKRKNQPELGDVHSTVAERVSVAPGEARLQFEHERPGAIGYSSVRGSSQAHRFAPRPGFARGFEVDPVAKYSQQPGKYAPRHIQVQPRNSSSNSAGHAFRLAGDSRWQFFETTIFEIWDCERIEAELDRLLGAGNFGSAEAMSPAMPLLLPGNSYQDSSQKIPNTAGWADNSELQQLLMVIYEPDMPMSQGVLEDEELLRSTNEVSQADWKRYCEFFVNDSTEDEQPQTDEVPALF